MQHAFLVVVALLTKSKLASRPVDKGTTMRIVFPEKAPHSQWHTHVRSTTTTLSTIDYTCYRQFGNDHQNPWYIVNFF